MLIIENFFLFLQQMKRLMLLLAAVLLTVSAAYSRLPNYPPDYVYVTIGSTNLPIVWINVGGNTISRTDRITATMKIIHNGDGQLNYADTVAHPGQHVEYDGYIALRYRGGSSFDNSPKKPYSFRPINKPLEQGGEKKKVSLLGMGKDNNWALLAPYSDKSMMRDLLAFEISQPWMDYTPQGRFCELFLDGTYYGVFILTEVVSKGKYRLNLDDPGEEGDELTGGYLLSVERNDEPYYRSKYHPVLNNGQPINNRYIYFQYKSPDFEEMTPAQLEYIKNRIDQMEDALASENYTDPVEGYRKHIDVMSFIDYQIAQEFAHNVDAYRLSGKFFKRRDSQNPLFKMVVWDMNLAYGNADYYDAWRTDLWSYQANDIMYQRDAYLIPFWWYKLNNDPNYTAQLKRRWAQYRHSNLQEEWLMAVVDSMAYVLTSNGAMARNTRAWPRWGKYVWPNYYISVNFDDELNYLKQWLVARLKWMDEQLGYDPTEPLPPLHGDVNNDGEVTVGDINTVIRVILGNDVGHDILERADVNADGEITVGDINAIIKVILGG